MKPKPQNAAPALALLADMNAATSARLMESEVRLAYERSLNTVLCGDLSALRQAEARIRVRGNPQFSENLEAMRQSNNRLLSRRGLKARGSNRQGVFSATQAWNEHKAAALPIDPNLLSWAFCRATREDEDADAYALAVHYRTSSATKPPIPVERMEAVLPDLQARQARKVPTPGDDRWSEVVLFLALYAVAGGAP